VADQAARLEETTRGCEVLSWYHALTANREKVIRVLQRRYELYKGPVIFLEAHDASIGWRLQEHRDYAWLVGDPEFDAITARIAGKEENPQE
jgi:hypothetical protein